MRHRSGRPWGTPRVIATPPTITGPPASTPGTRSGTATVSTSSASPNELPEDDRLRPPRELDYDSAPLFEQHLRERVERGDGDVVVDFAEVDFTDSSGLAALVRAHRDLAAQNRRLLITGTSRALRRVLGITGLDRVLHLVDEA